ncbi:homocysteine S-methyltransferase [Streptomyces sp. NPDC058301]|uniref:homocysteine S-methyltransferase n=1 Tax=Streptomyces sp. NPDC058301 TaxID=3346436 RepID=UPI0036EFFFE7
MRPARALADALAEQTVVLDGGLSNQLEDQGCGLSDPLWSARLLADDPSQIEAAHEAYVRAGAHVLITSSYQATYEGFARRGVPRREATALLARSVELARKAGETGAGRGVGGGEGEPPKNAEVWVAASIGPYGAFLADGSEYRGRYGLTVKELERFHRPRVETLAEAEPDVLALETVPDADEAEALLRAVEGCGVPVWLSYSVEAHGVGSYGLESHGTKPHGVASDGVEGLRTRAGQPLEEAFALVAGLDQVIAVGVNCCTPAVADRAVELAASVTGKPVVVYPNSGERWDARARSWRGGATFDPSRVQAWQAAGARLVGGCCRVGPAEIARLAGFVSAGGKRGEAG